PEESYWQQVYAGMLPLIRREKIGMEFYGPNLNDRREIQQILEMAILASCDGILLAIPNDPAFQPFIVEATQRKIPVVALANAPDNTEISYVGISAYDLGLQTGKAFQKAVSRPTSAALLVNSNYSDANTQQYLAGFRKAIQGDPRLNIGLLVNSKGESIQAEEQTQVIIKDHPEIEAIICCNPSDTLGVAKLVVDLNQVSRMTIIGAGMTAEIAGYIRRGVIWGVLADDPAALGAQGLATLLHFKNGLSQPEIYQMPLSLIQAHNVDQYEQKFALRRSR
ncbi:MAG TPA: substrate-binding domain-containing protein, partial [Bacillota bacterium]|nr:substrate-binding domain-containing protein [Bacillota bacterium]